MKERKLIRLAGFDYTSNRYYFFTICTNVRNGRDHSLQLVHSLQSKQTNPKIKPLPELIGAYKTTVSKRIHLAGDMTFRWQKSYHEHIIRNNWALNRIKHYIQTNPENWNGDPIDNM